jgi:hypothetical protein
METDWNLLENSPTLYYVLKNDKIISSCKSETDAELRLFDIVKREDIENMGLYVSPMCYHRYSRLENTLITYDRLEDVYRIEKA